MAAPCPAPCSSCFVPGGGLMGGVGVKQGDCFLYKGKNYTAWSSALISNSGCKSLAGWYSGHMESGRVTAAGAPPRLPSRGLVHTYALGPCLPPMPSILPHAAAPHAAFASEEPFVIKPCRGATLAAGASCTALTWNAAKGCCACRRVVADSARLYASRDGGPHCNTILAVLPAGTIVHWSGAKLYAYYRDGAGCPANDYAQVTVEVRCRRDSCCSWAGEGAALVLLLASSLCESCQLRTPPPPTPMP